MKGLTYRSKFWPLNFLDEVVSATVLRVSIKLSAGTKAVLSEVLLSLMPLSDEGGNRVPKN